ncbi:MAG: N-acetylneuraminate synthase [Thermodesulfobacteriota bacterium]|nr:N-acetylneuraminate synthase [Thermodesulfobacteriota bacterium]
MHDKIFIIAEAGVNHNGSVDTAKRLIDVAREANADAVKFQTFKTGNVVTRNAHKAEYQVKATQEDGSQFEMIKKLELSQSDFTELFQYCRQKGLLFLSTPFDLESVDFLHGLGLEIIKIPSGEITNVPYLRKIGSLGGKVILSTGMSDLGEVEDALDVLTASGTSLDDITVLHCNTEYPTPFEDVNLRAMRSMAVAFGVRTGYSDHTNGIEVPVAAAALGAVVIEKHFTLDRNLPGPDHKASLEPEELKAMVRAIRNIEKALGQGIKKPSPSEIKNIPIARRSIVAARPIKKGERLTEENLIAKRPGTGISPMRWDEIIGQTAKKDYEVDDLI